MAIQLEIAFENGLTASDALRRRIVKEAEKLEKFHERIVSCRVALKGRSHRRRKGDLFDVRLQLVLPGRREMVIDRNPSADHAHEDPYVALRDAFNAARRRLQDAHRRQQGQSKVHAERSIGRIVRLDSSGYGFIETDDGREIYFHRNALTNKAPVKLRKGARVRFLETETDGMIKATSVHLAGSGDSA